MLVLYFIVCRISQARWKCIYICCGKYTPVLFGAPEKASPSISIPEPRGNHFQIVKFLFVCSNFFVSLALKEIFVRFYYNILLHLWVEGEILSFPRGWMKSLRMLKQSILLWRIRIFMDRWFLCHLFGNRKDSILFKLWIVISAIPPILYHLKSFERFCNEMMKIKLF